MTMKKQTTEKYMQYDFIEKSRLNETTYCLEVGSSLDHVELLNTYVVKL